MFEKEAENVTWVDLLISIVERDNIIWNWKETGALDEMYKGESYSLDTPEDKERVLQDILDEKGYKAFLEQFPGNIADFDAEPLITNNQEKIFHKIRTSFIKNLASKYAHQWLDELSFAERNEIVGTEWSDYKERFLENWKKYLLHIGKEDLVEYVTLYYSVSSNGQNYYKLTPSDISRIGNETIDQIERNIVKNHAKELIDFPEEQNEAEYEKAWKELCEYYPFNRDDKIYMQHWLTQTKRSILGKKREYPMMLCLYSPKQGTGKSWLAYWLCDIINKKRCVFTFEDLTARFKPLEIASEAVIVIDEIGSVNKDKSDAIKSLITAEGKISIERKYRDAKDFTPKANYILTSNKDPAELFYFDSENRRLAVIEFPQFKESTDEETVKNIVKRLWDNAPVEYSKKPSEVADMAKQYSQNDDVFEWFYTTWIRIKGYANGTSAPYADFFLKKDFTALNYKKQLDYFCDDNFSKSKIVNYLETKTDYFEKKKYTSGGKIKNTFYKMTDQFIEALKQMEKQRTDGTINIDSTIPTGLSGSGTDKNGAVDYYNSKPDL